MTPWGATRSRATDGIPASVEPCRMRYNREAKDSVHKA